MSPRTSAPGDNPERKSRRYAFIRIGGFFVTMGRGLRAFGCHAPRPTMTSEHGRQQPAPEEALRFGQSVHPADDPFCQPVHLLHDSIGHHATQLTNLAVIGTQLTLEDVPVSAHELQAHGIDLPAHRL